MKHALSFSSVMPFNHRGYSLKPLYSPRPDYSSSLLWYSLTWTFSTNFSFLVHLSICSLRWTWLARVMPFLVLRSLHTKSCSKRPTVLWDHELWNSWTSMFWNFKSISENHLLLFCCCCWFGLVCLSLFFCWGGKLSQFSHHFQLHSASQEDDFLSVHPVISLWGVAQIFTPWGLPDPQPSFPHYPRSHSWCQRQVICPSP